MTSEQELRLQHRLTLAAGFSPVELAELITRFSSAARVFAATDEELIASGVNPRQIQSLRSSELEKNSDKSFEKILKTDLQLVSCLDGHYPIALREIAAYPLLLYCRGDVALLNRARMLAVVGSRDMSEYGRLAIEMILPELVQFGLTIVSGMAFGVDACAHEVTLKLGGKTVAVQAQGAERGYPKSNQDLYEKIVANGLVVSEFAQPPAYMGPERFPQRNRILSGLSEGVLVIEAAAKSGSLTTAYLALEQNRNVYAVPGNIDQRLSRGCFELIKRGAVPVAGPEDILTDFGGVGVAQELPKEVLPKFGEAKTKVGPAFESEIEKRIYHICQDRSLTVDEITEATGEPVASVTAALTKMAILGWLSEGAGKKFQTATKS